jgi:hypothetical protein
MNKIVAVLLLGGSLLATGCSRPAAEAPASALATPTPPKAEEEVQTEKMLKANAVEAQEMKMVPANDKPIIAGSPSPSASNPKP